MREMHKIIPRFVGLVFSMFIILTACTRDEVITPNEQLELDLKNMDQLQLAADLEILDAYLAENNISAIEDATGLRYIIHQPGDGISPSPEDAVEVKYTGMLLDGSVFDSSNGVSFSLERLILGWRVGIPKLKEGGSATLYIPSVMGYGPAGFPPDIPGNANLIFEIELLDVVRF